jgi:hypothetical protein
VGEAGAVFEGRAIVHPPSEAGGRPVCIDDRVFGNVHSVYDLPFLQNGCLTGWDARHVPDSGLIAGHRGEPEVRAP